MDYWISVGRFGVLLAFFDGLFCKSRAPFEGLAPNVKEATSGPLSWPTRGCGFLFAALPEMPSRSGPLLHPSVRYFQLRDGHSVRRYGVAVLRASRFPSAPYWNNRLGHLAWPPMLHFSHGTRSTRSSARWTRTKVSFPFPAMERAPLMPMLGIGLNSSCKWLGLIKQRLFLGN